MNLITRCFLSIAALAIIGVAVPSIALGDGYPVKPVRLIVPFPPGGATDIVARIVVQELSTQLGQSFFVENIVGASGNIGTARAARAAPDGYTVLLAYSNFVTNPFIYEKVPYDPYKD